MTGSTWQSLTRSLTRFVRLVRTRAGSSVTIAWLAAAGIALVPGGARGQPSAAPGASVPITLYVGQAHLLSEGSIRRIAIGNGKVVQATVLDERQLLLIPEAVGHSTVHLWLKGGGERSYALTVLPAEAGRLLAEVQAMLGSHPTLQARLVGDKVVVDGHSLTEEIAARVAEVARRFPQVVNLVGRVGLERMITMDVRIVEIRREALENLGVRWNAGAQGPSFGIVADLYRSNALRPGGSAAGIPGIDARARVAPVAAALGIATSFTSVLNYLVQNGDAVVLAEPQLSCRSGGSARFIAGGELPIPFSSGLGATSVQFREYGVKFDVSPVANDAGVIAAKLATEISSINFDVTVNNVPGLNKRRAETEVNLRENETLVIAGLVTEESARNVDKVAGLGDLPILGRLFRSRQFRDRLTELVVFITPRFTGADAPANREALDAAQRKREQARERVRIVE